MGAVVLVPKVESGWSVQKSEAKVTEVGGISTHDAVSPFVSGVDAQSLATAVDHDSVAGRVTFQSVPETEVSPCRVPRVDGPFIAGRSVKMASRATASPTLVALVSGKVAASLTATKGQNEKRGGAGRPRSGISAHGLALIAVISRRKSNTERTTVNFPTFSCAR